MATVAAGIAEADGGVTVVPATFVGKVPSVRRCDCCVVLARELPRATAMLSGAMAFTEEGSVPNEAPFNTVIVPDGGRDGVAVM